MTAILYETSTYALQDLNTACYPKVIATYAMLHSLFPSRASYLIPILACMLHYISLINVGAGTLLH